MLGWNTNRVGKVWINENFALNTPIATIPISKESHEKYIVAKIAAIVNRIIRKRGLNIELKANNFEEAKKIVQYYAEKTQVRVPTPQIYFTCGPRQSKDTELKKQESEKLT